jgi:hypothetical protein
VSALTARAASRLAGAEAAPVWCRLISDDSLEFDENVTSPRVRVVESLVRLGERDLAVATWQAAVVPRPRTRVAEDLVRHGCLDAERGRVAARLRS